MSIASTSVTSQSPEAARRSHASDFRAAMERACARIAPTWPLDRFIAVNPFWGMIDESPPDVSAELTALSGTRLVMPRAYYRREYAEGRLRDEHLREAIVRSGSHATVAKLQALLDGDEPAAPRRARVMDVVDAMRDLKRKISMRDFVTTSTSQFCASYFDEGQAQLRPDRTGGLYASFRRHALIDKSPRLLAGWRGFSAAALDLPHDAHAMAALALHELDVPEREHESYLFGLLLDLNGWAAWCAYRRWTARLAGGDDASITELLGIRLAWEWLLYRSATPAVRARWQLAMASWPAADAQARAAQADDWLFQRALEIAWQRETCAKLPAGLASSAPEHVDVQAVFCIDVRSETFRRALEAQTRSVQTLGFAGFFGLPIEYRPLAGEQARPQLPGLLAPKLRAVDAGVPAELAAQRRERLTLDAAWARLKSGTVSAFAFVEALGLRYAAKLWHDSRAQGHHPTAEQAGLHAEEHALRKPRIECRTGGEPLDAGARADLAAGMLRAMSLTRGFARVVLLTGHGSETRNNPYASGLDCGACCGQTGEVNARAAAALLNDPEVRAGLAARGIEVPASTWFLPGLHNTTTDEVQLFDLDEMPPTHVTDLAVLRAWLQAAGARTRAERAARLGLASEDAHELERAVTKRARDWSEVRPEWGLANNCAFIVAPREHTRHLDLQGRSFLHEYRYEDDAGFAVLELIMTAPMVVTHWINMQYYASTVDNVRYGSGNKVLHNVVGGHLGVFEGNGGDLRIGLSMQSLHDGERFVHTPQRLSVFIEAPRPAIESVLRKHQTVRALVDNGWLDLFQLDAELGSVHAYRAGEWVVASGTG